MPNDEEKAIISIQLDEQAKAKTLQGLNAIQNAYKKVGGEGAKLGTSLRGAESGTKALDNAQKDLGQNLKANEKNLQDQIRSLTAVEDKAKDAGKAISDMPQASSGGASIGGSVADIRGALGTIGGGAIAPALDIASGLGDAVAAIAQTGVAGGVAAIAIGALGLAISQFTAGAERQAAQLQSVLEAQSQVTRDIASGLTTEDAQAQLAQLEAQKQAEQELLTTRQAAYDSAIAQLGAFGALAQQIAPQEQVLADAINENKANIASYDTQIRLLNQAVTDGVLATNDTAEAEAELAKTREQKAQRAIAEAEQAAQRVAQAEQQIADLRTNRAIQAANAEEVASLQSKFAKEDEKAKLASHLANIESLRQAGAEKVQAIEAELANSFLAEANAQAEAQAKGNAALDKLNQDYFKSQVKATQDFATSQKRIASDTAKAASRLAEDLADNLADAARSNDIVAFLKIQRDGQKEQRRNAEDASEEEKRRVEDFIAAQEEQRQAFQARQAEILAGIQEERAKIAQSFAERRSQLEAQRQQELTNTQQAILNAKARYEQEQALKQQQAQRDAQLAEIRAQQEAAAFQRQITNIQNRVSAEGQVESAFLGGISRIVAAASAIGKSGGSSYYSNKAPGQSSINSSYNKAPGGNVLNINMQVGDIPTGSQVKAAINESNGKVFDAIINAFQGAQN